MKKAKFNLKKTYILITLFAVLMLNLCWWGTKKQGFYCDEMYSYHFVCQTGYPSVNGDKDGETYLNTWHTPEHFMDYLTITPEEAFDFAGVCKTIGEDVHPPVYYLLLEIVCSIAGFLLPGAFTKWCGIGLNMLFFALTILALFFMGRKIYRSDFWAALTCILHGISAGAVTTVMFLRMYMIFTFTCVLFSWVNFEFFKQLWEGEKKKRGLLFLKLFAVTVLGILNHYYFFLFAFFTCLLLWGCILLKKKFVFAFQYAAVMGTGIGFSYLLWPYMREDIFSGYRGVEAFDNLADGSGYAESIRMFCRLMQGELMGIGAFAAAVLLLTGLILIAVSAFWKTEITIDKEGIHWKLKRREPKSTNTFSVRMEDLYLFQIALAAGLYLALVAKIAPYREDRYILNIYPMVMLTLVWITKLIFQRNLNRAHGKWIAAIVLCCVVLTGNVYPGVNYLYKESGKKLETADQYAHLPAFYVTKDNNRYRAAGDSYFLARAKHVYPLKEDGIFAVSDALDALEKENGESYSQFFVYVDMTFENEEEILGKMEQELGAESAQKLFETEYTTAYLVE